MSSGSGMSLDRADEVMKGAAAVRRSSWKSIGKFLKRFFSNP